METYTRNITDLRITLTGVHTYHVIFRKTIAFVLASPSSHIAKFLPARQVSIAPHAELDLTFRDSNKIFAALESYTVLII